MNVDSEVEEIRWQVMLAMLEEFPMLRARIKAYLKELETSR
jgi:hypothetical protein